MAGTLSTQTFRMPLAALDQIGVSYAAILDECAISRGSLDNPFGRVPIAAERKFWRLLAKQTGNEQIGVLLGGHVPFGTFSLMEYVGASCQTVLHPLQLLARYAKIVYGGWNPELEEGAESIEFLLGEESDAEDARHTTEFTLSVLWSRLKFFASSEIQLREVRFRHSDRGGLESYRERFGCEVRFDSSEDVLILPPSFATVACRNASPIALGSLLHGVDALYRKLIDHGTEAELVSAVKRTIEERVAQGEAGTEEIAAKLGMSKRTLQRRLETSGRSLRAITAEVRRDQATKLLRETDLSVEQIGLQIGYSDLKAFNRAFSEWYGMTPAAFRRTQRG